jgi:hypothetical protein
MEKRVHHDDILVKREFIEGLFHPPLSPSTFERKVQDGFIVPCPAMRSYYIYNETRRRLGLEPVEVDAFKQKNASRLKMKDPYGMQLAAGILHVMPELRDYITDEELPAAITTAEYGEIAKVGLQLTGFLSKFTDPIEKEKIAMGIIRNRKFRSAYLPEPG